MTRIRPRPIGATELADRLRDTVPPVIWNVLTDDFFDGRMVPGSQRVPLDRVVHHARSTRLPLEAEIVVYGAAASCPQGVLAAAKLAAAGYRAVRLLRGGLDDWESDRRRCDSADTPPS